MKTLFLSVFDGLFSSHTKENSKKTENNLFLTSTNPTTGRTLIIEEYTYSVWAYMLRSDKEAIDFEGYLCTVVDPKSIDFSTDKTSKNKKEVPLPPTLVSRYSYIRNLKKEDVHINWKEEQAIIHIRNKPYLIMDVITKTSYSKGLAYDCEYGKVLEL
ncbi:hypothetical protein [Aquimarina mytili]|uniref:Uncharacterized protein n=1 Tax=Aquimarina mytili TaxID=874423 RepID=A0A937DA87_9FLAO|nr:hypothetical protein [Aquimarina mytili]MBL0683308.1 hypothetical protein [Aquimarina mytili]